MTDNCITNDYKDTHLHQVYTTKSFCITALITDADARRTHFKPKPLEYDGVCDVLTSNTECGRIVAKPRAHFKSFCTYCNYSIWTEHHHHLCRFAALAQNSFTRKTKMENPRISRKFNLNTDFRKRKLVFVRHKMNWCCSTPSQMSSICLHRVG